MTLERLQGPQEIELDPITIASYLGRTAVAIIGREGVFKIDLSDFEEPKVLEIEPAAQRVDLVKGLSRSSFKNVADVSVENGQEDQTMSVVFLSEQVGKISRVSRLRIEHVLNPIERFNCTCDINVPFAKYIIYSHTQKITF